MLFSVFITLRPEKNTKASVPVFNVKITGPLKEEAAIPGIVRKPVIPIQPAARKLEKKQLPPDTMYGEGKGTGHREHGQEESKGETPPEDKGTPLPENNGTFPSTPKDFIFDDEIIEKYAREGDAEGKNLTFDVKEFNHRGYMGMLRGKIESIWEYPKEAAMHRISGDLNIRFTIKRDGSVGDVELIRTSGYRELDEAALKAIKDAEPFWPLPVDWDKDELTITGHFIYIIGNFYML